MVEPGKLIKANSTGDRPTYSRRHMLTVAAAGAVSLTGQFGTRASEDRETIVDQILEEMPLKKRIAQLFIFQAQGAVMTPYFESLLKDVHPGGIIFVQPNIGSLAQIKTFVSEIHRSNRALPPLISIDQEGGNVIRLAGDPAPGALDLGRLSYDDVREKSKQRSDFLSGFGFDVNFAPVADVAYNASSTMYLRSFGNDPEVVADKVKAVVRGARARHIMGAAKHFPGHGRTSVDSHYAIPTVDLSKKEWARSDALPFKSAIGAGVEMVMVGHLKYTQWDDQPMSLSRVSVDVLRNDFRFHGIIVTDDLGMGALAGMPAFDVLDRALDAGMDALLYTAPPAPWASMVDHVADRVKSGAVSRSRIDESVRRLLRVKVDHFGIEGKAL